VEAKQPLPKSRGGGGGGGKKDDCLEVGSEVFVKNFNTGQTELPRTQKPGHLVFKLFLLLLALGTFGF